MSQPLAILVFLLAIGIGYVRVGRNPALKRLLLPLTTAGLAALLGLYFAAANGGDFTGYAVGVPLGLSIGLTMQHLFDFCRRCGAGRPLRLALAGVLTRPAEDGSRCTGCKALHFAGHRHD